MKKINEIFLKCIFFIFLLSNLLFAQVDIIIYSDKPQYQNQYYTKFQGICFENGIKSSIVSSKKAYNSPLVNISGNPKAVIYDCWIISEINISNLRNYVRKGGYLVLFYSAEWSKNNSLLQELFNISINAENVVLSKHSGSYIFPSASLPFYFSNNKIGIITPYEYCTLPAYLTVGSHGSEYYITSDFSKKSRTIIFEYSLGEGKVLLFPTIFGTSKMTPDFSPLNNSYNRFPDSFICDRQIDHFDNESAARQLIRWLTKTGL